MVGWYKDGTTVGVIFTGLLVDDKNSILSTILNRVSTTLRDELTFDQFNQVSISLHFFPDDWEHDGSGRPSNPALYPDLTSNDKGKRPLMVMKTSDGYRWQCGIGNRFARLCASSLRWQSRHHPKALYFSATASRPVRQELYIP